MQHGEKYDGQMWIDRQHEKAISDNERRSTYGDRYVTYYREPFDFREPAALVVIVLLVIILFILFL